MTHGSVVNERMDIDERMNCMDEKSKPTVVKWQQCVLLCCIMLLKLKFHWDQFPRNFPVANVTGKSPTSYGEVGRVGHVASLSRGSYGEVNDFQTISTCRDGLATSLTSS